MRNAKRTRRYQCAMQWYDRSGLGSRAVLWHGRCTPASIHSQESAMILILSSITKGEDQLRRTLDRLTHSGIAASGIVVLHPGEALGAHAGTAAPGAGTAAVPAGEHAPSAGDQLATAGAAASGGAAVGMFGWLVGYGILAIPGALLIGAIGAVAGAAIAGSRRGVAEHIPDEVQHHYVNRIVDDHAAVLVKVEDIKTYELVLQAFLDHDCRHILTTRNQPADAEAVQIQAITQAPTLLGEAPPKAQSAGAGAWSVTVDDRS
jgi:hypothetical protein